MNRTILFATIIILAVISLGVRDANAAPAESEVWTLYRNSSATNGASARYPIATFDIEEPDLPEFDV